MASKGPKPLPPHLKKKKLQVHLEKAVSDEVARYGAAWNLTMSEAARVLIVRGIRAVTGAP